MIIGVDGNEANVTQKVGVSTYTDNLLHYFHQNAGPELRFKIFLKNDPCQTMPRQNRFFRYEVIKGRIFWSQFFLPLRLYLKKDIDIFFSPAHYAPRFCSVPYVVTIHDLAYLYYPDEFLKKDLYKLKKWTSYSLKNAASVIAVSQSTKKDILKNYPVPENKIKVIYNGYEKKLKNKIALKRLKETNGKQPFILYVGTIQPRKNIDTLIKAFADFKRENEEYKLIIAGKKGWLFESVFDLVNELGLSDSVYFTDYISDRQLAYLYQNAFCLVLPSFYEGFGIPVLEAMSFGCPVIASFSSSLPEVGGDACLYFNPKNLKDLSDKLRLLKKDGGLRSQLTKKGKLRIKLFSWKDCAEQTLNVLKSVHEN
ncbi:glycosyltransferase family 4 protein [Candidatus Roizmanbacteria bacterium]|nr:glycosyltransferase family 4 protein [Candidatus Roizmanbacteria bacterium]